jgi:hypothetical protein
VITVALAASSGCSFIFSEGAPDRHETRENFTCGESYAPPVLDTIAAGALGYLAANLASNKESLVAKEAPANQDDTRRSINVTIGILTAGAVIGTASAIYGYPAVSNCQEARNARQVALIRAVVLPPPYGVPPAGGPPPYWPPPPPPTHAPPPPYPPPPAAVPPSAAPVAIPPEDIPPMPVTPLPPPAPSP